MSHLDYLEKVAIKIVSFREQFLIAAILLVNWTQEASTRKELYDLDKLVGLSEPISQKPEDRKSVV